MEDFFPNFFFFLRWIRGYMWISILPSVKFYSEQMLLDNIGLICLHLMSQFCDPSHHYPFVWMDENSGEKKHDQIILMY